MKGRIFMPLLESKTRFSVTFDKSFLHELSQYCKKNHVSMSKYIAKAAGDAFGVDCPGWKKNCLEGKSIGELVNEYRQASERLESMAESLRSMKPVVDKAISNAGRLT